MRQIVENFGVTLLAVMVTGMAFTFVLGNGGIGAIGERMEQVREETGVREDLAVMENFISRRPPEISYNVQKSWRAGERVPVAAAFHAVDADGIQVRTEVLAIEDGDKNSRMELYYASEESIWPDHPGIYWVTLRAEDGQQKETVARMALVADSGGEGR